MALLNSNIRQGVGHIELNRPDARNAINLEMVTELRELLSRWASMEAIHAVVFSGAGGKAFAGGADIAELKARTHRESFWAINASLFQQVEDFPRPTVAAIDGYALGGGLELALACDLRVASKMAKVGLPETTLGIYPAAGGTWRLPRLIGLGRAKEWVFTGRIVEAEEAFQAGLFERLVETDALKTAWAIAEQIAQNAPLAVQVAKVSINALSKIQDAGPVEKLGQALLFDSAEKHTRMSAFLERRTKKS